MAGGVIFLCGFLALPDLFPHTLMIPPPPCNLRITVTLSRHPQADMSLLIVSRRPSQARHLLLGEVIVLDTFLISLHLHPTVEAGKEVIMLPASLPSILESLSCKMYPCR